jgi:hypothetical protein
MPRNKSKKYPAPLAVRLSKFDQTNLEILYHYYNHLTIDGEVGFNNENAGSIKHKQSAAALTSCPRMLSDCKGRVCQRWQRSFSKQVSLKNETRMSKHFISNFAYFTYI